MKVLTTFLTLLVGIALCSDSERGKGKGTKVVHWAEERPRNAAISPQARLKIQLRRPSPYPSRDALDSTSNSEDSFSVSDDEIDSNGVGVGGGSESFSSKESSLHMGESSEEIKDGIPPPGRFRSQLARIGSVNQRSGHPGQSLGYRHQHVTDGRIDTARGESQTDRSSAI